MCDLLPFYKIAHNISEMTPWDSASWDVVKYMVSANIWQTFEKELAKYIYVLLITHELHNPHARTLPCSPILEVEIAPCQWFCQQ